MSAKWIQRATYLILVAFILYLDYQILRAFFTPLAWAAVLAIFFHPVHHRIYARLRRANFAAGLSLAVVLALLVGPAVTIGAMCVQQGIALSRSVVDLDILPKLQTYVDWALERLPFQSPDLEGRLLDAARAVGTFLARHSATAAGSAAQFFMELGVMVLALFFLFRDGDKIVSFLRDTAPLESHVSERVFNEVDTLVTVTLQSTVIVALAQGTTAGLLFWIFGLPAPVFIGVLSAVLAFLPVIGPALVWAPAGIILLIMGDYVKGAAILLLGNFGISGIDNLLRPILISDRAQMNALLSLLSVLGGIYAFGFLGMVLGPLVVAVTIGMLKGYREELRSDDREPAPVEG